MSGEGAGNAVIEAMAACRTVRRFDGRRVPHEVVSQILKAGSFAPSAGGRRSTRVVACDDDVLNDRLGKLNRSLSHDARIFGSHVSDSQPSIVDDPSIESAFYDAPCVLTLFGPADFPYASADAWVKAGWLILAAQSLGVGSCLVSRARETFDTAEGREAAQAWGIPDDYEGQLHVVLGYPA